MGQGVGRLLGYATQVALARMYGPAQLGFYVLGFTVVQVAGIFSQFGMNNGVVRYVAHYRVEGDTARVRGTILLALWTTFALSLVLAVVLFFGAGILAERVFDEPLLKEVFRAFSLSLPFFAVMGMALWSTQGFQTVKYVAYVEDIQRPLLNLILVIVFYLLGAQVLGAVLAFAISMAVGVALAIYYLRRVFPELLDSEIAPKFEPRSLFGASAPMVVANFSSQLNSWVAVAVVGIFATANAVGVFNVAARTAALSGLILASFQIFMPMVSDLYKKGQMDALGELYQDVSRWTFTGSLFVFLATVLLAKDILTVFGPEFVSGWVVMVLMSGAQLFNSSVGHTGKMLAMTGYQKVVMTATIVSSIVAVVACVALVPGYGILGAGLALSASIILTNVITLFSVNRLLGFWPYNRKYLRPIAAGVAAVLGAYAIKLAVPMPVGIVTVAVVGSIFLVMFSALLLVVGLGASDRQLVGALWSAVRRTARFGS